jgi:hypothetical protein
MFIERVVGDKRNRGQFIELSELTEDVYKYGKDQPIFRSVYLYTDPEEVKKVYNKRVSDYAGEYGIDVIPIDIDKSGDTDEYTLTRAREFVSGLAHLGLDFSNFNVFFSGTGYHIDISNECFGFTPNKDLPWMVKETIRTMFSTAVDYAIYSRASIIRVPFTKSEKSGLYKVPLTEEELFMMNHHAIHLKARSQLGELRTIGSVQQSLGIYRPKDVPQVRLLSAVVEPSKVATCIHKREAATRFFSGWHLTLEDQAFLQKLQKPPSSTGTADSSMNVEL